VSTITIVSAIDSMKVNRQTITPYWRLGGVNTMALEGLRQDMRHIAQNTIRLCLQSIARDASARDFSHRVTPW
jgi:hypothetical protein